MVLEAARYASGRLRFWGRKYSATPAGTGGLVALAAPVLSRRGPAAATAGTLDTESGRAATAGAGAAGPGAAFGAEAAIRVTPASWLRAGICVRVSGPGRKFMAQRVWNSIGAFS